jgi:hypothetical protein
MGAKTLLTFEHLERLPETCDVSYELDQGERVEVSSASLLPEIPIYNATTRPVILTADDLLEDAALLPGFSVRVEELFAV